jgi:prepilin-type N-terminal cleavage/methylation domain-containing protein
MKTWSQKNALSLAARQRGFSLIELLVAVVIGLLSIYAVYNVYDQNARANRSTTSFSNLQMTGVQALFAMRQALIDAGSGLMSKPEFDELEKCQSGALYDPNIGDGDSTESLSLRPVPVVLGTQTDLTGVANVPTMSGSGTVADPFVNRFDQVFAFEGNPLFYGLLRNPKVAQTTTTASAPPEFSVSGLPFRLKQNDVLVRVGPPCGAFLVTSPGGTGTGTDTAMGITSVPSGEIVDIGQARRFHIWVDPQGQAPNSHNVLMLDQYAFDGQGWKLTRTPLIANVQDFVAQYGLDDGIGDADASNPSPKPDDNIVDRWVDAGTEDWLENEVEAGDEDKIKQIKAIRIGFIARTDRPDRFSYVDHGCASQAGCFFKPTLFGTGNDTQSDSVTVDCGDLKYGDGTQKIAYRCFKFETTIPLRNSIWNWTNGITLPGGNS